MRDDSGLTWWIDLQSWLIQGHSPGGFKQVFFVVQDDSSAGGRLVKKGGRLIDTAEIFS